MTELSANRLTLGSCTNIAIGAMSAHAYYIPYELQPHADGSADEEERMARTNKIPKLTRYRKAADAVLRIPTNKKDVFSFKHPPKKFNPLAASDAQLLRYGFPLRPRGRNSKAAAQIWEAILSRPLKHIMPKLTIARGRAPKVSHVDLTAYWAGRELYIGGPFQSVFGIWVVPAVLPPPSSSAQNDQWFSSTWAGIGGDDGGLLLQAGTVQWVVKQGSQVTSGYYAFFQFGPPDQTIIRNFPVGAGETIAALVTYNGKNSNGDHEGTAQLINLTRNTTVSLTFTPKIPGGVFNGFSAQWIVERPTVGGQASILPYFGQVTFTNCFGCSATSTISGSQNSFSRNMKVGPDLVAWTKMSENPTITRSAL